VLAWAAENTSACIVVGPPASGKTMLCADAARMAAARGASIVAVSIGRASGVALEHEVLRSADAQLRAEAGKPARAADTLELRAAVEARLVDDRDPGAPELWVVLDGLDEAVEPLDEMLAIDRVGRGVLLLLSTSYDEERCRQLAERLGGAVQVALGRSEPAIDAAEVVEEVRSALDASADAAPLAWALDLLSSAFAPLEPNDWADFGLPEAPSLLVAARPVIGGVVAFEADGSRCRFVHETLRVAWEERAGLAPSEAIAAAGRRVLRVRLEMPASPGRPAGYLGARLGAHLVRDGAPVEELASLALPEWAAPTSADAAAVAFGELRRVRRAIERAIRAEADAAKRSGPVRPVTVAALARCAIGQGALATLRALRAWEGATPSEIEAAALEVEAAVAMARLALADSIGGPEGAQLRAEALADADRTADGWRGVRAVARAARSASGEGSARWAARAAALATKGVEEDDVSAWLELASVSPEAAAPALDAAIAAIRDAPPTKLAPLDRAVVEALPVGLAAHVEVAARGLPPAPRLWLLSQILERLPANGRTAAIDECIGHLSSTNPPLLVVDGPTVVEALIPHLDLLRLRRLGDAVLPSYRDAIAERFAALGCEREALELAERESGAVHAARALLRVVARLEQPRRPAHAGKLREQLEKLRGGERGALVRDHARALVLAVGAEAAVELADGAADELGQYPRIVALARVAAVLSGEMRMEAARRAAAAYDEDPDWDAVGELAACAPWLAPGTAAELLASELGETRSRPGLVATSTGWGGIAQLSGAVARAGGPPAVVAVAAEVAAAPRWLRPLR
jgi:hypothetical protein